MKQVREARKMTGPEFAAELERLTASLDVPVKYDAAKVSKHRKESRCA